jgi:hypothetical protein
VYNFAMLEYHIAHIIERLKPGYLQEYISQKKMAGDVAKDFVEEIGRAKHAAETKLTAIYNTFVDLKDRRNQLLHANPGTAPGGAQELRYQQADIAWDLDTVCKAATDFEAAAVRAIELLHGALSA